MRVRRLVSSVVSAALIAAGVTLGAAQPATALESTLLSPSTVEPGSNVAVTIEGTDYRIENSVYQFQFEGFSGLTSCSNIAVTTNPAQGASGVGAVTCTIPAPNQIKLVFGSATPTATRGSVTVEIGLGAGLVAPQNPGTYGIVVRDWQNAVIPGISGSICVGYCTQQVPIISINIDSNGGNCRTTRVIGYQGTWSTAPDGSNCQKPGQWLFRGYNTSADGSGLAIAPGGNLHLTNDNTLYAIYYAPRAPGSPTDVVAVGGRNAVSVTWKPPADLGEPTGASYVAQASPNGARCAVNRDAQPGADGRLGCTISVPASQTPVSVVVRADNFFATSAPSAASNTVRSYDLVLEAVERPKANVLDRLFKGQGSTIKLSGRAPGLAGQKVTPQLKIGSGDWESERDSQVTVDPNGDVTWSKILSKKVDKQTVEVRFAYRSEASNAYAAGVGQTVGLPSVPRDLKLKAGLGEYTVSWKPSANDGGSPVTSYVVTSNLKRFACTVKAPATSCVIPLNSGSATGPVDYTVAAVSARGTGKAAKGNGTVVYRWIQPLSVTTYPVGDRETEVNILFYADGLQEKQVTVELRIGKDGAWKKKGNPEPVSRPNRMFWSGILDAKAQNQPIYLRASTPYGTSRVRQIR